MHHVKLSLPKEFKLFRNFACPNEREKIHSELRIKRRSLEMRIIGAGDNFVGITCDVLWLDVKKKYYKSASI